MQRDINIIEVYRMIHCENLDSILHYGIHKENPSNSNEYVNIGSPSIISYRSRVPVKCFPGTMVNDYIPFYFAVKTPMLYKIKTGHGVSQLPQDEIIYLVCNFKDIADSQSQWCYTDGNAASSISEFYNSLDQIEKLDWKSIESEDWSDNNRDGDNDRMRKKHSEFLVKDHVAAKWIKRIVVLTESRMRFVENLVNKYGLAIFIQVDKNNKFYFS